MKIVKRILMELTWHYLLEALDLQLWNEFKH